MSPRKRRRPVAEGAHRLPRRVPGWIRSVGWLALILASLFMVTWRQTRGLELERALRDLETRKAAARTEVVDRGRSIATLRSRARIVRVAGERLGMHLAVGDEIVFLPAVAAPGTPDADANADAEEAP